MKGENLGNPQTGSGNRADPDAASIEQFRRDLIAVFGPRPIVERCLRWVIGQGRTWGDESLATDCLQDFLQKARTWQQEHHGDVWAERGEGYWLRILKSTCSDRVRKFGTTSQLAPPAKHLLQAIRLLARLHTERTPRALDGLRPAEQQLDAMQPCLQTVLQEATQPSQVQNTVALISFAFRIAGTGIAGSDLLTLQQTLVAAPRTWRDFRQPAPSDNEILAHLPARQRTRLQDQLRNPTHALRDLRRRFYEQCVARYQLDAGFAERADRDKLWVFVRWLLTARTDLPRNPRPRDTISLDDELESRSVLEAVLRDYRNDLEYWPDWLTLEHGIRILLAAALHDTTTVRGLVARTCIALRLGFPPSFGTDLERFECRIVAPARSPLAFDYDYNEDKVYSLLGSLPVRRVYPHLTELSEWIESDSGHRVRRQRSQFVTAVVPKLAIQHGFEVEWLRDVALWLLSPRTRDG